MNTIDTTSPDFDIENCIEMDSYPIFISKDFEITQSNERVHSQESYDTAEEFIHAMEKGEGNWSAISGITNQYGYNGPIMHESEFLTNELMKSLAAKSPGLYATVSVWEEEDSCGWMLLHKPVR